MIKLLLAFLLAAVSLSASCESAAWHQKPPTPAQAFNEQATILATELPAIPLTRDASSGVTIEVAGSDTYRRSSNTIDAGFSLRLLSSLTAISWGIWELTPQEGSNLASIQFDLNVPPDEKAFVGVADYQRGCWVFNGPLTQGKTYNLDSLKHYSPQRSVYVAVAVSGGSSAEVVMLTLAVDDPWTIVPIDITIDGDDTGVTSIALINGKPGIAYMGGLDKPVRYAEATTALGADSEEWNYYTLDIIEGSGTIRTTISLAQCDGKPAVAYINGYVNGSVCYARQTDTPEIWDVIALEGYMGQCEKLSLTNVNTHPVVCYKSEFPDWNQSRMVYAYSTTPSGTNTSDWRYEDLPAPQYSSYDAPFYGPMVSAAEVNDDVALAFISSETYPLVGYPYVDCLYARQQLVWENGSPVIHWVYNWMPESGSENPWLHDPALAVIEGYPAIAVMTRMVSSSETYLKYMWSSDVNGLGDTWQALYIPDQLSTDFGYSLGLAELVDHPVVCYFDNLNKTVRFAWAPARTASALGWTVATVDRGTHPSIANINGYAAVAYFDFFTGTLKYAIRLAP